MSRQILNDHPWTDDEIQYKLDRNLSEEIALNRQEFPPGSASKEVAPEDHSLQLDQDIFEHVNGLDSDQLKSGLQKAELDKTGDVPTLKKRLAQHLQDLRDGSADS